MRCEPMPVRVVILRMQRLYYYDCDAAHYFHVRWPCSMCSCLSRSGRLITMRSSRLPCRTIHCYRQHYAAAVPKRAKSRFSYSILVQGCPRARATPVDDLYSRLLRIISLCLAWLGPAWVERVTRRTQGRARQRNQRPQPLVRDDLGIISALP